MSKGQIIFACLFLISLGKVYGKAIYPFWDDIHIKHENDWYVKQDGKFYRLDFNAIEVVFGEESTKENNDSILLTLNCVIQKTETKKKYYVKLASGYEFFNFIKELSSKRLARSINVKTFSVNKLVDTLITEIRLRDKLYLKRNDKWYFSQSGKLYEIVADVISFKIKNSLSEREKTDFLERNKLSIVSIDRLGICNAKVLSNKHAIFLFLNLFKNPMIDFIELITMSE